MCVTPISPPPPAGARTPAFPVTPSTAPAREGHHCSFIPRSDLCPPCRTQMCIAAGPGKDMFESTKMIAERQYR